MERRTNWAGFVPRGLDPQRFYPQRRRWLGMRTAYFYFYLFLIFFIIIIWVNLLT